MAFQKTIVQVLLSSLLIVPTTALTNQSTDASTYSSAGIITRDVCIIGGGSSGTYGAISLRDKGKSVVVIEAQSVLGGHTNTYRDPAINQTIDYGVVVFDNTSTVRSYFSRFDIPLTTADTGPNPFLQQYYVDSSTGKNVTDYVLQDPTAAFAAYAAQLAKYPFLNNPGWDLPDPVPADLLIPFGDFVKKYKLDAAVFTIFQYAQGFGDILCIPTLYILKYFGQSVLAGAQTGFLTTARHDNSEIYEKARIELGADVFLSSKVLATQRPPASTNGTNTTNSPIKIQIQTPTGKKLIVASKLLISIPPLLSNLAGFDLSTTERDLFAQWMSGAYYTALLRDTTIPENTSITSIGADTAYNLPELPTLYALSPTRIPHIFNLLYGVTSPPPPSLSSPPPFSSDPTIQRTLLTRLTALLTANNIPSSVPNPEYVAYNSHTPYELRAPVEAVERGFYKDLQALQGEKGTWWTGAAWDRHESGELWGFTEGVVQRMGGVGV